MSTDSLENQISELKFERVSKIGDIVSSGPSRSLRTSTRSAKPRSFKQFYEESNSDEGKTISTSIQIYSFQDDFKSVSTFSSASSLT